MGKNLVDKGQGRGWTQNIAEYKLDRTEVRLTSRRKFGLNSQGETFPTQTSSIKKSLGKVDENSTGLFQEGREVLRGFESFKLLFML